MSGLKSDIGQYCIAPLWVAEAVSAGALKVYVILASKYADRDTDEAIPRRKQLMNDCGIKETALDNFVTELKRARALVVTSRQTDAGSFTSNTYLVRYSKPGVPEESGRVSREDGTGVPAGRDSSIQPLINNQESINQATSSLPLSTRARTERAISALKADLSKYQELFPTVDVSRELDMAGDWLLASGKVKKDYPAFLRNWLRRKENESSQHRPGTRAANAPELALGKDDELARWLASATA